MGGIPLVNVAAVIHLFWIAMFIGVYAAESVIELHAYFNRDNQESLRMAARYHFWIDTLVEIPLLLYIFASGVWLAFLVEKLTPLHWVLMSLAALMVPGAVSCILTVRKRRRMLLENASADALREQGKHMMVRTLLFINPFLIGLLLLGFWLAYNRVLNSIYG